MSIGGAVDKGREGFFQVIHPGTCQQVAIGSGSLKPASTFHNETSVVRLVATVDCFVQFGTLPVASAAASGNSMLLPASSPEYFGVPEYGASGVGASAFTVAVIQSSAAGTLYITEGKG
jgi:hypothetical protein